MNILNRRKLLQLSPSLALLSTPVLARPLPGERAEQLIAELIDLLKAEAPEGSNHLSFAVSKDFAKGSDPTPVAVFLTQEWEENPRLKDGGHWIDRGVDIWPQIKKAA